MLAERKVAWWVYRMVGSRAVGLVSTMAATLALTKVDQTVG